MRISPEVAFSKPAMMRSKVVFPEPLSPRMVRNSPSATSSEISRNTGLPPKDLARLRIASSGAARGGLAPGGAGWLTGVVMFFLARASLLSPDGHLGSTRTDSCAMLLRHRHYCAAFTSFQISLYLARSGTFCQK